MNGLLLRLGVAAGLIGTAVAVLVAPQAMLSPGALLPAHRNLPGDCLACHALFRGAPASGCVGCHAVDRIGRFTTTGQAIAKPGLAASFHDHLLEQDCMACHVEHRGPDAPRALRAFSHDLLKPAVRDTCVSCHTRPGDSLHRQIEGGCRQCHTQERWRPASFEHEKFFVLDADHAAPCATCHVASDFSRYTCYGCHEHSPEGIRAEHEEEGIRDFQNCVACHRSAEEAEGGAGEDDD